jgi:cytidylate kinase
MTMVTPASSLHLHVDALERAQRHWQERHRPGGPGTAPLTIALERQAGAPGTSVAQEVGRRLGWPVYDHELLEQIARESGLRVSLLESVDERRQSWLTEAFQSFAEVPQVTENTYVRHLAQTILSLGAHGSCIIVGRGAGQILPPANTLRVGLIGRREDRIALAAQRRGLQPQDAARWVDETDRQRIAFVKDHFYKDPADKHQYDLLLSVSRWSVTECADLVVQAVHCLAARVQAPAG